MVSTHVQSKDISKDMLDMSDEDIDKLGVDALKDFWATPAGRHSGAYIEKSKQNYSIIIWDCHGRPRLLDRLYPSILKDEQFVKYVWWEYRWRELSEYIIDYRISDREEREERCINKN